MRRWKAVFSPNLLIAAATLMVMLAVAVYLFVPVVQALTGPAETWPINALFFLRGVAAMVALSLAGILLYRIAAALTLTYTLDRNGLYILWLGNQMIVPIQIIDQVTVGIPKTTGGFSLLKSLGYFHGQMRLPDGRTLHRFSTRSPARALVIATENEAYAISPREADAFLQDLDQRQRIGPIQPLSQGFVPGRLFAYPFWQDRMSRNGVLLALLFNLVLLGGLMLLYADLPLLLSLRTDASGAAANLVPRHQILFLPLAGLLIGLINAGLGITLFSRSVIGARMLQLASAGVQMLFIVAALTILL